MTPTASPDPDPTSPGHLAFIGGGNMATAIIGGLIRQGWSASRFVVVEPFEQARSALHQQFGIEALPQASAELKRADLMIWAVKPQTFAEAALAVRPWATQALHLSVAAGIRVDAITQWLGTARVVRSMPNTPALIGQGMTGLYAPAQTPARDRAWIEQVLGVTGRLMWVDDEVQLDAVTALSGSGPAYVFFVLEALIETGVTMGLSRQQAHELAVGTFEGASALAARSQDPPDVLRARVTSRGGTTHAAITRLQEHRVQAAFADALRAAQARAAEMANEFSAAG